MHFRRFDSFCKENWFQAEFETFKRKIRLRANDLAGQLVNEYLHEERSSPEWNDISRIALPQADPNAIDKILLSPLGIRVFWGLYNVWLILQFTKFKSKKLMLF